MKTLRLVSITPKSPFYLTQIIAAIYIIGVRMGNWSANLKAFFANDNFSLANADSFNAVIARNSAEGARNSVEGAGNSAESSRNSVESARNSAEGAGNSAESPRNSVETARNSIEMEAYIFANQYIIHFRASNSNIITDKLNNLK